MFPANDAPLLAPASPRQALVVAEIARGIESWRWSFLDSDRGRLLGLVRCAVPDVRPDELEQGLVLFADLRSAALRAVDEARHEPDVLPSARALLDSWAQGFPSGMLARMISQSMSEG